MIPAEVVRLEISYEEFLVLLMALDSEAARCDEAGKKECVELKDKIRRQRLEDAKITG